MIGVNIPEFRRVFFSARLWPMIKKTKRKVEHFHKKIFIFFTRLKFTIKKLCTDGKNNNIIRRRSKTNTLCSLLPESKKKKK